MIRPSLQWFLKPSYKNPDPIRLWKITTFHQFISTMIFLVCIPMALFIGYTGAVPLLIIPIAVAALLLPIYPFLAHNKLVYAVTLFEVLSVLANIIAMQVFGLNDPGYFSFFNTLIAGLFLSWRISFVWSAIFSGVFILVAWYSPVFTILPIVERTGGLIAVINSGHHVSSMIVPLWSGSVVSIFFNRYVTQVTQSLIKTNLQLDKAREFSDRIITQAGDGIAVLNDTLQILLWNPAMEKICGVAEQQALGQSVFKALHGFNTTVLTEYIAQAQTGQAIRINSLEFHTGNHTDHHWCSADFTPNRSTDGTIEGVVILLHDLTEQKQIEDTLRQSQKMEAVGQLAGGVAHDFNNQLTAISGYAEMLSKKITSDVQMRQWIDKLIKSTTRASDIIHKLLAFARKSKPTITLVNVHDIVGEACDMLEHSVNHQITIVQNLFASPLQIHGDPSLLQNALLNLGINARDAMPRGGTLTFTTSLLTTKLYDTKFMPDSIAPGDYVVVQVSDTGTGIIPEIRAKIFDPFFTTKAPDKGTGMGLAAVYGTIKQHKGSIKVESEVGKGTTFTIVFPASSTEPITEPPITRPPHYLPTTFSDQCILLVDDDVFLREIGRTALTNAGFTVKTAVDGIDATQVFNQQQFHCVVMDIIMPRMNGIDALQAIRAVNPTIPVLLVSGYSTNHPAIDTQTMFLGKPFTGGVLITTVKLLLSKQSDSP